MLGKGLESLIPPQQGKPDAGQGATGEPAQNPPASQTPIQDTHHLLENQTHEPKSQINADGNADKRGFGIGVNQRDNQRKSAAPQQGAIFHIEVDKIKPNPQQPRRHFDEEALKELASSIREFGVIQPIVVSKIDIETPSGTDVEYQLIAGERRWLASKILGLERIPAIIRNVDLERERLELAIIENIQREDLNPIERARAFARLQDEFRLTQREIASRLGKSREAVANSVRLLDLPANIREALEKNQISESHGRLLLAVDDPGAQEKIFRELLEKRMTTRDLKNKVRGTKSETAGDPAPAEVPPEIKMLQEKLSSELGAPVKIESEGERGKITITFFSPEELRNIIGKLGGEEQE